MDKINSRRTSTSIKTSLLMAFLCSAVFVFLGSCYADSFPNHVVDYNELNGQSQRDGVFIPIDNLQQVQAGYGRLTQQNVIEILGASNAPSFSSEEDVVQGKEDSVQEDVPGSRHESSVLWSLVYAV